MKMKPNITAAAPKADAPVKPARVSKIAPAIGLPSKSPNPAKLKHIPIHVPPLLRSGERAARAVGGSETIDPEKQP